MIDSISNLFTLHPHIHWVFPQLSNIFVHLPTRGLLDPNGKKRENITWLINDVTRDMFDIEAGGRDARRWRSSASQSLPNDTMC